MLGKPIEIRTRVPEIHLKLPMLNYTNEIVFSKDVPKDSLREISHKLQGKINIMKLIEGRRIITKEEYLKMNVFKL